MHWSCRGVNLFNLIREKKNMKIFGWLSCILVAAVAVVAEDAAKVAPKELQIETTFKPDACPHQAKKGDRVEVHYVSH